MGLAGSMVIECLEVHNSSWFSVVFGSYHHPAAPLDRVIDSYRFQNPQSHVTIQPSLDSLPPVQWDLCSLVYGYRGCCRVNVKAENV